MNDEAPSPTTDKISDGQFKVTIVLIICSSVLSIIGSGTIAFKIVRDRVNNGVTTSYDRFVLGLSTCDILSSINLSIGPFLYPSGRHVWAFGTPATCEAVGFLLQFSTFWALWYSSLLSFYFLLTVLSQVRRTNYVQTFEPWMHLTGAFFPVTAITGLFLGWFGGDDDICWIADDTIEWIVGLIPLLFVYASLIINYGAIYVIVGKSIRSSEHVAGSTSVRKRIQKETTIVMFSYVAVFFVCITPSFVLEIVETYSGYTRKDSKIYPVFVLESIFLPLLGFFNFFIYIKPAYTRFRAAYPTKSMGFVLHQALFNSKTPRLYRRNRNANHHTYHSDFLVTDITLGEDNAINLNQALFDPGQFSPDDDDDVADGDNGGLSDHPEESKEGEKEPDLASNEDANEEGP